MNVSGKQDIKVSEKLSIRLSEYDKLVSIFKQLPQDIKPHLVEIRPNMKNPSGSDSWKTRTFSFEYGRDSHFKKAI